MIGLTLYAKRRVPVLTNDYDDAQPVRFIEAGQRVGIIATWLSRKPGNEFWYWGLIEYQGSQEPYFFVPHDPSLLDLPQLQEDLEIRNEEIRQQRLEWWEQLAEGGGGLLTTGGDLLKGVVVLGSLYLLSKIVK